MSETPIPIGTRCHLQNRRHPGRACLILANDRWPLYEVRVAANAGDPAPNAFDYKAEKILATHSTLTPESK